MAQSIMEQRWGQIRGVADEKSVNVCYPRETMLSSKNCEPRKRYCLIGFGMLLSDAVGQT